MGCTNDDDEEEARERRRRAREERKRMKDAEESGTTDVINTNRYHSDLMFWDDSGELEGRLTRQQLSKQRDLLAAIRIASRTAVDHRQKKELISFVGQ